MVAAINCLPTGVDPQQHRHDADQVNDGDAEDQHARSDAVAAQNHDAIALAGDVDVAAVAGDVGYAGDS